MRVRTWIMALSLATAIVGCAARQHYGYALPPNANIEALHENILSCATEHNLSGRVLLSRLWINIDADTLLIYNLYAPETSRMTVRLDSRNNSEADEQRLFSAAKQMGDTLMACAQAKEGNL